ncbi:hypothetical protein EDD15DRAFT_2201688 [Pisolithus albus]|nr:hypothetical protein EDD15DRAFT_2201688 [Pisolithus albus]
MSSAQDRRRGVSHQSTEIDGNRRKSTRSSIGSTQLFLRAVDNLKRPSLSSAKDGGSGKAKDATRSPTASNVLQARTFFFSYRRKLSGALPPFQLVLWYMSVRWTFRGRLSATRRQVICTYNSGDLVSSPRDDTPGHQILTRRFRICTVTGNSAVSRGALLFLCSFVPRFGCTTRQRTMPSGKPPHPPVDADVEGAKCFFPQAPSRLTLEQERNRSAVLPQHLTNLPIHASPPRFAAPIPIPLVVADPQSKNHLTDPVTGKIILSAVSEAYNRMLDTLGTVIQIAERALEG